MRRILASILLLTATALAASQTADESAIRGLVQRYVDARNHQDAKATQNLFTPDADQLVSTGEWRRGLNAMVRGMMASSRHENARSTITVETVRLISPDVAIADGRYETTSKDGSRRQMWTTIVAKRMPDGWRIAAIRNMLPAPNPNRLSGPGTAPSRRDTGTP